MSESNNNPNTDKALDNEAGVNEQGAVNNTTDQANLEQELKVDSNQENELPKSSEQQEGYEDESLEGDDAYDEGDHSEQDESGYEEPVFDEEEYSEEEGDEEGDEEAAYMPVPGVDEDFYEDYYEGIEHQGENGVIKPDGTEDEAAKLYSNLHGVGSVIRENAQLTQSVKATRKQMLMSMGVNIALASLVVAMIVAFGSYPKTRYIPTSDNRAICEVTPENNPNITDVAISDFAKDAVLNLYTFDYVNYEDQIDASLARWFTASGRVDTINAMRVAGITDYVKNNALTLRAGTTAAAKIEQKGRAPTGQPYWVVRFPMVVDVYSGAPRPEDSQRYIVSVRIIADDATAQNPKGLGVASAALEPLS